MDLCELQQLFQFTEQIDMLKKAFFIIIVAWIPECISYLSVHHITPNVMVQNKSYLISYDSVGLHFGL